MRRWVCVKRKQSTKKSESHSQEKHKYFWLNRYYFLYEFCGQNNPKEIKNFYPNTHTHLTKNVKEAVIPYLQTTPTTTTTAKIKFQVFLS